MQTIWQRGPLALREHGGSYSFVSGPAVLAGMSQEQLLELRDRLNTVLPKRGKPGPKETK